MIRGIYNDVGKLDSCTFGTAVYTVYMALVTIKNKYQIVIPAKVRREAGLRVGDFLEATVEGGKITLSPQMVIDRKHLAKLPKGIRKGLEDVYAGRVREFRSVEELRKDLES